MTRKILLSALALAVSVLPPLAAIISYFPLWSERGGEAVLSGFTALLLLLAAAPVYKLLHRIFASPSVWLSWLLIFLLFLALSRVADEMVVVSFVGFISNAVGALLFKLARKGERNEQI